MTKREQRQRLIDSFVNAVYLYEDKIILTFNYKDGSKTITLAEVEGSDLSVLGAPKACDKKDVTGFFLCCIVENWRFRQLIFELLFIKMSSGFQTVGHFYCLIFPQNSELRQGRGQFFLRKTE